MLWRMVLAWSDTITDTLANYAIVTVGGTVIALPPDYRVCENRQW